MKVSGRLIPKWVAYGRHSNNQNSVFHNFTTSQLRSLTASQLHSITASQPNRFTASQILIHEVSLQLSFVSKVMTCHQCICHTLEDLDVLQKLMCPPMCAAEVYLLDNIWLQKAIASTACGWRCRSVKQFSLRMFQVSISLILVAAELDLWSGFGC